MIVSATVATFSEKSSGDRLADVDHEVLAIDRGEAGELDGEIEAADRQRAQAIDAFGVADAPCG